MAADIDAAAEDHCDAEKDSTSEALRSTSEEESSESEASSSSSSDEDDKKPLAELTTATQRAAGKPPGEEGRKRVNRFPKIPKHMRCGRCENCLNPQRKKACIPARQRMEQQMREQRGGGSNTAHAPAAAAAKRPTDDPFTRALTGILSSGGGVVQDRHVGMLLQLVKRARSKPHRTALLVVLQLSAPEVQRQAVAAGLLLDLQDWLREFVAEGKQALVQKTLGCLDRLPVTLAALQPPCELGKMVGRLRKHESFGSPVIEPAKRLVAKWKAVVEQGARGAGAPANASSAPPAAAAKAAPAAAAGRAAPAPALPAPAAAAKPAAAGRAAAPLEEQASGSLAVAEDGDLFKGTDKQRTSIKEAGPPAKKVATVKTISVEPTRGRAVAGAQAGSGAGGTAAPKGQAGPGASSGAPPQTDVARVSASPFSSLGGLGSGVTVVGSGGSGLSLALPTVGSGFGGAKERAAAAARRVPSPEPQPRKEKGKKVSWQKDDAMVGVRWFRKDDPPSAAQRDATVDGPVGAAAAAARAASPPKFESAAKKEHLSEAAALRQHRAEEDQERHAMDQRLEQMVPATAWTSPQPNDALSAAQQSPAPPAAGEDSTEAARAAAARHQEPAATYAQAADVPDSPEEPLAAADCGRVQHPATIPRMPLSLEVAAAAQQQQQQQEWQPAGAATQQAPYAPAPQLGAQQQQQQQVQAPQHQQQNLVQPGGGQNSGLPDISAALAQLAASGILNSVPGPTPQGSLQHHQHHQQPQHHQHQHPQHQQPQPQHQPSHSGHAGMPRPGQQWQGEPGRPARPPATQRSHSQRPCRYFNTPKGCYMGDRCNFAHIPQPDTGQARHTSGLKRQAADAGSGDIWRGGSFKRGRV